MKKLTVLIFINLCFAKTNAQDSLHIQQLQHHFYYEELLKNLHDNPFVFYVLPIENYTKITLSYNDNHKKITKTQQAKKEKNIIAESSGFFRLKNTLFSGKIMYQRNYFYKHGYNSTNLNPFKNEAELSPIYKLSYQPANWNNQFYQLNGNIIIPVIKGKLFSKLGVDYKTLHFFRIDNNPLVELIYLDFTTNISLFLKITPKSYIGFSGRYHYLDNLIETKYEGGASNVNFPANTEVYDRISYGYGIVESSLSLDNNEYDKTYGGNISYIHLKDSQSINTKFTYTNTKTKFYTTFDSDEILLANYNTNKYSTDVNWYNYKNGNSLNFKANYTTGDNFRIVTNGKNYEAKLFDTKATFQKIKKDSSFVKHNYGLTTGYYNLKKIDYQAVNNFNFSNLEILGFYGKDLYNSKISKLYFKGALGAKFNIKNESVFFRKNRFTTDLAIPNFAIDTANKINTMLEIGYQKKIKTQTFLNIGTTINQQNILNLDKSILQKGLNYSGMLYLNLIY